MSILVHGALLVAAVLSQPTLDTSKEPTFLPDATYPFQPYLVSAAEQELDESRAHDFQGGTDTPDEGRSVAPAEGQDGKAGSLDSDGAAGRIAAWGPEDNPDPGAPQHGFNENTTCCMVGPLKETAGNPTGLLVDRSAQGVDPENAQGNTRGPDPTAATGRAATSTTGSGPGGPALACTPRTPGTGPSRRTYPTKPPTPHVPVSPLHTRPSQRLSPPPAMQGSLSACPGG